jgi:hypothetical protein
LNSSSIDDNKTIVDVSWNIDLYNMPISDQATTRNNIMKETTEALNRIAQVAE